MRRQCEVRGLLLGGCFENATPGGVLCHYHEGLREGRTVPPPDCEDYFNPENDPLPMTAYHAYKSYLNSTHPEFADLVNTGGYIPDAVPAAV